MDLEEQKSNFKNHVATFTDLGNIKILDFKAPGTNHYRIRFLFEEDYYRLHISGDLGELIATNYHNMCWKDFLEDYTNDIGYFEGKISCHNRSIYAYDEDVAKEDLKERISDYGLEDAIQRMYYLADSYEDALENFFDDVFIDFSDESGVSQYGYDKLSELDCDAWEYAGNIGKRPTGILDLYMLAFKLAVENLKSTKGEKPDESQTC